MSSLQSGHRARYTMLAVTINTNKAANTASTEALYKQELVGFIRNVLSRPSSWQSVLNIEPADALDHIDVSAIGVERGPRKHRIHAHFVVTVQHHGKISWKYTQKKWQALANANLQFTRGSNVNVDLLSARHLNYVSKAIGTSKQIAALSEPIEVQF